MMEKYLLIVVCLTLFGTSCNVAGEESKSLSSYAKEITQTNTETGKDYGSKMSSNEPGDYCSDRTDADFSCKKPNQECNFDKNKCQCVSGHSWSNDGCRSDTVANGEPCQTDDLCFYNGHCLENEPDPRFKVCKCYDNYQRYASPVLCEDLDVPSDISSFTVKVTPRENLTEQMENNSSISPHTYPTADVMLTWTPINFESSFSYTVEANIVDGASYVTFYNSDKTDHKFSMKPARKYSVTVIAVNKLGNNRNTLIPIEIESPPGIPGHVENLKIEQDDSIATAFDLSFDRPEATNGEIEGYVIKKIHLSEKSEPIESEMFVTEPKTNVNSRITLSEQVLGPLEVGHTYSFSIKVRGEVYDGMFSSSVNITADPRTPFTPNDLMISQQTELSFRLSTSFTELLNKKQGKATLVAIFVNNMKSTPLKNEATEEALKKSIQYNTTWSKANEEDFMIPFRVTPDDFLDRLKSTHEGGDDRVTYVIGGNENCDYSDVNDFCNGKLPTNTELSISLTICNTWGCDTMTFYEETGDGITDKGADGAQKYKSIIPVMVMGLVLCFA